MFYKVIKDNKVIDVLDILLFVRYCPIRKRMINSSVDGAQGILSSDQNTIWHLKGLKAFPIDGYESVSIEEIDSTEYRQLKALNGKTPEEIIDEYTLYLIEEGIL